MTTTSIFTKPMTQKEFKALEKDILTISIFTQSRRFDIYSVTFRNKSRHYITVKA